MRPVRHGRCCYGRRMGWSGGREGIRKSQIPNPKSQSPKPKAQSPKSKAQIPSSKFQVPGFKRGLTGGGLHWDGPDRRRPTAEALCHPRTPVLYACDVVRVSLKLHTQGRIAAALSTQLVEAAVSAAANAEEADDGSSRKDFLAKERICLRELKESRLRLRVLRDTGLVDPSVDPLIHESLELIRIVSTIIRNAGKQT